MATMCLSGSPLPSQLWHGPQAQGRELCSALHLSYFLPIPLAFVLLTASLSQSVSVITAPPNAWPSCSLLHS